MKPEIQAQNPAVKSQSQTSEYKISLNFENRAIAEGFRFIAGVDEVGRGALAGAVVAAACILDLSKPLPAGLNDSKKLSEKNRLRIDAEVRATAVAFAIAQIEAVEIDRINILQATKKAMRLAIENLAPPADFLLVDAVQLKEISPAAKSHYSRRRDFRLDCCRFDHRQNLPR